MAQESKKPRGKDAIDENLQRVYKDVLDEKVPDRFLTLLDQLKAQDAANSNNNQDDKK